ncbi:MAG: hypothetical protein KGH68_03715 [Patescibacteria group bacterium]|nr:hypothetical protein [Patescibacteria group bacterium]
MKKTFSIGQAFAHAWNRFVGNWQVLGGVGLILTAVNWLIKRPANPFIGPNMDPHAMAAVFAAMWPSMLAMVIAYAVYALVLLYAITNMGLIEGQGRKFSWGDTFPHGLGVYGRFVLFALLYVLIWAVFAVVIIFFLFIAGPAAPLFFLIGGLAYMFVIIKLQFATLAIVEGMGPIEAFKRSFKLTEECFWKTLGLVILVAVISIIGALTVIGTILTLPISIIAVGKAYDVLKGHHHPAAQA